jgi:outer membrane protein assembly factor BamB
MQAEPAGVVAALPDYEIGRRLGEGQFGVVWAARHRRLGRAAAVKQLTGTAEARNAERFRREARLLAQLDHRHVVKVYDYREVDGLSLLIMERLTGGTFAERRAAGLGFESIIVAMIAAASGLHHLHERGVLHRDVKPANLMFDAADVLKVTDFGTARGQRILGASTTTAGLEPSATTGAGPHPDAFQLSFAGEFMGTPGYAAPEQAAGALGITAAQVGPAADQYALAAVLYQSLTGCYTHAIDGGAVMLLSRRATSPARPAQHANPAVPHGVSVVIMRALELRPADRFGSVEEFALALAAAAAAEWGTGWAHRSTVTIAEPGPLWDAVHGSAVHGSAVHRSAVQPDAVTLVPALGAQLPPNGSSSAPPAAVPPAPAPAGRRRVAVVTAAGVAVIAAVTAAAVVLLQPAADGGSPAGSAGVASAAPVSTSVAPVALDLQWRFPTGGNVFATPTVLGDLVVVGSFDGTVYGIERESGSERWRLPTGGPVRSSAATAEGLLYLGSNDGMLRAIRQDSGQQVWQAPLGYEIVSSPAVAGGLVVVGADKLYAFDAVTGAPGWSASTGDVIVSSPVIDGELVIVGSNDGHLYGFSLTDGTQVWKLDTGGAVVAAPVVVDGVAFVGSRSGMLFAVAAASGSPLWQRELGGAVNGAVAVAGERVLAGTEAGTVQSLRRSDGSPQWTWSTAGRIDAGVAVAGSSVVVASSSGTIWLVDIAAGVTVGGFGIDGPVLGSPRVNEDQIYLGSYDDAVYRLRMTSS